MSEGLGQIELAFTIAGVTGLSTGAYQQFYAYLDLMMRWNQRVNLTSVRQPEQIIRRHFVECAFVAQHLPPGIGSLLDYGSGAGLPGIPIAICRPEIQVTLAEAGGKKASFLREALRILNVNGEVYDGRVEAMSEQRRFEAVSVRAVEKMELAIPVAMERTARFLVLLTTEQSAPAYRDLAAGFVWDDPITLPNSRERILAIGRRV